MKSTLRTFLLPLLAVAAVLPLHEGSTQQDPKRPPVRVPVGETAILPLNLNTTLDINDVKVEWCHDGEYVHVFENDKSYLEYQNKAFTNRAFLFEDQISEGNVSLKLINVTEQDAGNYTCTVLGENMPKNGKKFEFKLYTVDGRLKLNLLEGPKPDPTPTPEPNQDRTRIIFSVVAGVAVLGVIAVFYKRRGNRNNQNNPGEMQALNDHN
ncbi:butyrophilin-like protein 8 [Cheilinus undulatus]|uniref:butyrophilin-like protein 8 n=1 Tax=Cheilinus undulatus TaxID=241271 RepID=UPI001BD5714E|nr:butyrophilin-like protein 8 [Cheilinus undulatus]